MVLEEGARGELGELESLNVFLQIGLQRLILKIKTNSYSGKKGVSWFKSSRSLLKKVCLK